MKVKTNELTGVTLRWAVAQCEGVNVRWSAPHEQLLIVGLPYSVWQPHKDWNQGGPILDREGISLTKGHSGWWIAKLLDVNDEEHFVTVAPTPLIAAMRCYVMSKLGDTVDIPEEVR